MSRRALLAVLLASAALRANAQESLTLEALLAQRAASPGIVAQFHERRFLAVLGGAPLESEGTLYFQPPDRLAKLTTAPAKSSLVFDLGQMRFHDEAGSTALALADHPDARAYVETLIEVLHGDKAQLEARYRLEFHADGERWQLTLSPKEAPRERGVASIRLVGAGRALRELDVVEIDGDSTQLVFDQTDPDHLFGADESNAVFGPRGTP